jgi:hypothetical protein
MEHLPKVLLYAICDYLLPTDLKDGLLLASKELRLISLSFLEEFEAYKCRFLGNQRFHRSVTRTNVLSVLLQATNPPPSVLSLGATYTDGGVFLNSLRFWAQNMFEYTGSVYTTHSLTENVTVSAAFIGGFQDKAKFTSRIHEDLYGLLESDPHWPIPQRYVRNYVASECFMSGKGGKRGEEYTAEEYDEWGMEEGPAFQTGAIQRKRQNVFTDEMPIPASFALATTIGVARPAFATCPIHTLLICTKLQCTPCDLSPFYSLNSLDEIAKRSAFLPPIHCQYVSDQYSYVEFSGLDGPLLWFQFNLAEFNQAEVAISPRLFKQAEVLLIDIEDRRKEYGMQEKGIDVTYVLFGGREIGPRIRTIAELPEQASYRLSTADSGKEIS